jgi:oxaloacetate decarboxylase alpha subunit
MTGGKLALTDVVLRDAHQSLFATRLRVGDMLPIAAKLDQVGFWSLETWGGATFDACIRYLGEDPWERLRLLKSAMPNTRQQMLLRGQNLLGYRHYADDVVEAFVTKAAENGIDVFRIFDAMNDVRNLATAVRAALDTGKHAQGTICYTESPVHTIDGFVDMGKRLEDLGCHSICIKDMAGLLKPYIGYELVSRLKASCTIPVHLHSHATTGMSTATAVKVAEAGVDGVDTAISSMSHTYGHSATESLVAMLHNTERDTGLDLPLLEEIAAYFRGVRKKYAAFEGSLRGVDSRILVAQVPGGMLTNMENQLREQNAVARMDEVLEEIPRVRADLGYIPLVTPTSQIVGTQAVLNVLAGERYKTITKETAGVLCGEYGATAAPVNRELQARALAEGGEVISCRPADRLEAELEQLTIELKGIAAEQGIVLSERLAEDVLIYALFPQVGLKFLAHRHDPGAFEPAPDSQLAAPAAEKRTAASASYTISVDGRTYAVTVAPGGQVTHAVPVTAAAPAGQGGQTVPAPLAGTVFKVLVSAGDAVQSGDVIMILEAMKMETEVRSPVDGSVSEVSVKQGDTVQVGDTLLVLA